jgi:hypothetical protein
VTIDALLSQANPSSADGEAGRNEEAEGQERIAVSFIESC